MSDPEELYTSTGSKLWYHKRAMMNYRNGIPNTVISTHISPTSRCNLNCSFCSVAKRTQGNDIPMDTIIGYVRTLMGYGLKAVILTGGGEPLLYPHINELVAFLSQECGLQVALITNGTACQRLKPVHWGAFSWVRVSINRESVGRINVPVEYLLPDCVLGGSAVYAGDQANYDFLLHCKAVADKLEMEYVRVLPDCLKTGKELAESHRDIAEGLADLQDDRFFRQDKRHGKPDCDVCHQSFFRPYLSEEPYWATDKPGTVFPCDSVVLNDTEARFSHRYQICHADHVAAWLEGTRKRGPVPREECDGCVFHKTVEMLDHWKTTGAGRFREPTENDKHADFV